VDAQGLVTRWLHKGVVDTSPYWELDIPPRWVVKLAGLPFSMAWVPVSALDISKLEASCQASLISDGILFQIDCGTKQRTPAHISVVNISGVSQTPRVTSASQANIASLKAAITNAYAWEDSSMAIAGSDISSDRFEFVDTTVGQEVLVCVVPWSCSHAEDMVWIVNVSGLGMWKNSPLKEAFVSAREYLASCRLPICLTNLRWKQVHRAGPHRTGSSRSYKWGLGDIAGNEGGMELNSSEIEDSKGNTKHIGDDHMGFLGVILEE